MTGKKLRVIAAISNNGDIAVNKILIGLNRIMIIIALLLTMLYEGYLLYVNSASFKMATLPFDIIVLLMMLMPYVLMYLLTTSMKWAECISICDTVMIALISFGGICMYINMTFIKPDPQGAIAIIIVPIIQSVGVGITIIIHNVIKYVANK